MKPEQAEKIADALLRDAREAQAPRHASMRNRHALWSRVAAAAIGIGGFHFGLGFLRGAAIDPGVAYFLAVVLGLVAAALLPVGRPRWGWGWHASSRGDPA